MSSLITQLLARNTDEVVDLNTVKQFLSSGTSKKASKKQYRNFVKSAKQSEIGGVGTGFEEMTASQQREFIQSSRGVGARRMQELDANYTGRRDFVDQSRIPIGSTAGTTQEHLSAAARSAYQSATGGLSSFASHLNERLGGDFARTAVDNVQEVALNAVVGASNATASAARGAYNVAESAVKGGLEGGNIIFQAVRNAASDVVEGSVNIAKSASEQIGGAASGLPHAIKETSSEALNAVGNNPVIKFLAGDTSGKAAAEAGQTFQESYKKVFSSPATAEAFNVDQGVLKQAFDQTGDEFSETLTSAGLSKEAVEGLEAFRGEVKRVGDEGGQLSEEGMQAMLRNQGELGNMYGGFSRASASASPNTILRGLGGEGTGGEAFLGIMGAAALAGGANTMMGGDFFEGAAVGGGAAFGMRALAKGVAGSMGDIEQSMMKSILGDDMITAGTRDVTKDVTSTIAPKGTRITDLSAEQMGGLKLSDVTNYKKTTLGETSVEDYVRDNPSTRIKLMDDVTRTTQETVTEGVTGAQARRQNLEAIQSMAADDERLKGFGKKRMQKLLDPTKSKNTAVNNRALVLGGSMLSGVAFTGSADKRDYRRGFNAHRGNRI